MATNNLNLTTISQSQSQKEVTANQAFKVIDSILNVGAIDKDLSTPPVSPTEGDLYIVGGSGTDDWSSQDYKIAFYLDGSWQFITPNEGMSLWVVDEKQEYRYSNGVWQVSSFIREASGEFWQVNRLEITETALAGASVTTSLQIPDRAIVHAVHALVTTAVTGATDFSVGIAGDTGLFGSGIGIALDSTNIGIITPTPFYTDTDIVLTPNGGNFTVGEIKLVMHYHTFRGPWAF